VRGRRSRSYPIISRVSAEMQLTLPAPQNQPTNQPTNQPSNQPTARRTESSSSQVVMSLIKKYCQRGMMVICTIHQPRAAIWNLFEKVDDWMDRRVVDGRHGDRREMATHTHPHYQFPLTTPTPFTPPPLSKKNKQPTQVMVLSQGHQIFFGDASGAEAWFSTSLGYPRHHNTSAVDFIMDLVNVSFAKASGGTLTTLGRKESRVEGCSSNKAFVGPCKRRRGISRPGHLAYTHSHTTKHHHTNHPPAQKTTNTRRTPRCSRHGRCRARRTWRRPLPSSAPCTPSRGPPSALVVGA
jgi:hypothetical protein